VRRIAALGAAVALLTAACGGGSDEDAATTTDAEAGTTTTSEDAATSAPAEDVRTFTAEVWADNWFSLTVNGELVGEDSVPITTERSFNAETIEFEASYPLTIAVVAKDFREDDSGLEYIGTDRQQMGDGGLIAQITDTTTGEVVAVTGPTWRGLVIQRAPLDGACEKATEPATECTFEATSEPDGWTDADFDDASWTSAETFTADQVGAKDGYAEIAWDPSAELIWTASLEQDNTILWRAIVEGP
jgi:hypothetical protein